MRFGMQVHELAVSVPPGSLGPAEAEGLLVAFHDKYELTYARARPTRPPASS